MTLLWSVLARLGPTILDDNLHSICVFYLIFANPQKKKKKEEEEEDICFVFWTFIRRYRITYQYKLGSSITGLGFISEPS